MSFAAIWMELEIIMLSEVRRQLSYDITYMWNLKHTTNECIESKRSRLRDIENKSVVTSEKRGRLTEVGE